MNTLECLTKIEADGHYCYFKVENDTLGGKEIQYSPRSHSKADTWRDIIKTFGEQNWCEIKHPGYCSIFCPSDIHSELNDKYQRMYKDYRTHGCD